MLERLQGTRRKLHLGADAKRVVRKELEVLGQELRDCGLARCAFGARVAGRAHLGAQATVTPQLHTRLPLVTYQRILCRSLDMIASPLEHLQKKT